VADDIVERLQQVARANGCEAGRGCSEAAAEIERLRAALAERDAERLTTRAVIVRKGLHDLHPWWSPDIDGMVDPLADPETAAVVRAICKVLARDGYLAADDKHEEARRG
jgi:hypothetical protein